MQVNKKTSSGIQSLSLDAMLLDRRMVFLNGTITSESVNEVVKQLLFLESMDAQEPIKLILNSSGGEVAAGLFLYSQIGGMDVPVEIYVTETAASMAAIILAGGKHGRYLLEDSIVMIHEPLVPPSSGGLCGSASSIAKTVNSIMEVKQKIVRMLAKDTGHTVEEVEKIITSDYYLCGAEAVEFGICDAVVKRI